ncbi:MAG: hypothetical protein COX29_02765 [Candidatus Moranbacteria bacterium CG23_combo_of_CG06-09_8_20_14_all_35_22]|nr:MAG: hypothetical protein COX29_02765 [Candidatus Moranbacteria bacterium CG23_combo_of_CG06-09_8_20_14_all_35_22]
MQHYPKKNLSSFLLENKETVITSLVIVFCLALSVFFPTKNSAQLFTSNIFFLVIIPILYYKLILKRKISELGLVLNDKKIGFFWGALMFLVNLIIFYLLYQFTDFNHNYLLSSYIVHNFWIFLFYEILVANMFVFIQEFFWRGFILLYFSRKIGLLAIFLQFIIFVGVILLISQNSFWQMAPTLVISLTSGIIVYKSRSIFYSWIFSLLSILILDSFIIYHLK